MSERLVEQAASIDPVTDLVSDFRDVPAFDQARAEKAVRELLFAVGEDPDRDGLVVHIRKYSLACTKRRKMF